MKAQRSLKSRALQLLAQRDQSRLELRRKLLRHVRQAAAGEPADVDVDPAAAAAEVDTLLDWLEGNGFLSDARFAEARVNARQARFGLQRIRSELQQHAVSIPRELEGSLAASEIERAAAVRARRFAGSPADAKERAAQSRFLLGRGFSSDVVQRLMRRLPRSDPATPDGALDVD